MGSRLFEDAVGAKVTGSGNYLPAGGTYTLEIEGIRNMETRESGDATIVDFRVLESAGVRLVEDADGKVVETLQIASICPPGDIRNWFLRHGETDDKRKMAAGNWKGFLLAVLGLNVNSTHHAAQIASLLEGKPAPFVEISKAATEAGNLLCGCRVAVTTVNRPTKKNLPFTVHNWGDYPYHRHPECAPPDIRLLLTRARALNSGGALPVHSPPAYTPPMPANGPPPPPPPPAWVLPPRAFLGSGVTTGLFYDCDNPTMGNGGWQRVPK